MTDEGTPPNPGRSAVDAHSPPTFSPAYKRYVLAAMTSVYMLSLVDRGLMNLLLQPIKVDLQLSDTQLGLVTGIAFGLFYATLGVPIARWADRGNRVTITALAIGSWGITVMACLFVTSFAQLVFARVAAGVGEAGCKPLSYSLVGDYFLGAKARIRALSVYTAGNFLSLPLAYIVGGWLNELYGWRVTFFLMAIPGLLLAALVKLTIVEPRTLTGSPRVRNESFPSLGSVLATLWRQKSCRNLCIALILFYIMGAGMGPWKAAFMMRNHGMGTTELGLFFGVIYGVAGVAGALLGGYVASRWFGNNERAQMRMSAVAVVSVVPCYVAFLTLPGKYQSLIALVPQVIVFSVFLGPTYALMQRLVVDEMRATMMSVVMLFANLIGMGVGPLTVGILSDLLTPVVGSDEALRYAMLILSFVAVLVAYHFWLVGRSVKEDLSAVALHVQSKADRTGLSATAPRPA